MPNSYRSISLLSTLSKIAERAILSQQTTTSQKTTYYVTNISVLEQDHTPDNKIDKVHISQTPTTPQSQSNLRRRLQSLRQSVAQRTAIQTGQDRHPD